MKQIKILLGLILLTSVSTFAQSPRIKLNQITKDSLFGSVLISSPTDSGMVYSRELYISYGADTVLILNGDTLASTSGIISSVLSDGVTITGDGSVGNPLKVDTASVISTIRGLNDTLTTRGYLTSEVDGSITNEGSLTVEAGGGNDAVISSNTNASSDVTISGGTNVTVTESGQTITIAASGGGAEIPVDTFVTIAGAETITGAKTFTAALTQSGGDVNFDSGTLFVDESGNRVGIGTSSPTVRAELEIYGDVALGDVSAIISNNDFSGTTSTAELKFLPGRQAGYANPLKIVAGKEGVNWASSNARDGFMAFHTVLNEVSAEAMRITSTGNVGIGKTSPAEKLHVVGNIVATGTITPSYSDYNLKTNISDLTDGLDVILDLKPKTFNFISDNDLGLENDLIVGLVAQDVEQSLSSKPYLNSIIKQIGKYKAIDVHKIIPITVKAIQEQQAIIETIRSELTDKSSIIQTQASEINQLKSLIQSLTTRIENLENN